MSFDKTLFVLILAIAVIVTAIALSPALDGEGGSPHPSYASMRQGRAAEAISARHLALGWALGASVLAAVGTFVAFGARRRGRLRGLGPPLAAATLACVGVWTWLVIAYRGFAAGETILWLGFPHPTALMLFVLWPLSATFAVLYSLGYERWVLTDEDRRRYEKLVAERPEAMASPCSEQPGDDEGP